MRRKSTGLIVILCMAMAMAPVISVAGPPARLIPMGKVSLLQDGVATQQIGSEMPLPDGVMMLCKGQCLVRADGLQLVAKNDATFGVSEGPQKWGVTVNSGQIDFALSSNSKLVTFHTPHDVIDIQEAVFAANDKGVVRGTITVTDKDTQFNIVEGTAKVSSENGTKVLKDGAEIRSTQAKMGTGGGAGAGLLGGGAGTGLAIAGGAAALIIGGAVIAGSSGDGNNNDQSPSNPSGLQ